MIIFRGKKIKLLKPCKKTLDNNFELRFKSRRRLALGWSQPATLIPMGSHSEKHTKVGENIYKVQKHENGI